VDLVVLSGCGRGKAVTATGLQIRFDLQAWFLKSGLNFELKVLWWWTVLLIRVWTGPIFLVIYSGRRW
jgi:hypothetical protein